MKTGLKRETSFNNFFLIILVFLLVGKTLIAQAQDPSTTSTDPSTTQDQSTSPTNGITAKTTFSSDTQRILVAPDNPPSLTSEPATTDSINSSIAAPEPQLEQIQTSNQPTGAPNSEVVFQPFDPSRLPRQEFVQGTPSTETTPPPTPACYKFVFASNRDVGMDNYYLADTCGGAPLKILENKTDPHVEIRKIYFKTDGSELAFEERGPTLQYNKRIGDGGNLLLKIYSRILVPL